MMTIDYIHGNTSTLSFWPFIQGAECIFGLLLHSSIFFWWYFPGVKAKPAEEAQFLFCMIMINCDELIKTSVGETYSRLLFGLLVLESPLFLDFIHINALLVIIYHIWLIKTWIGKGLLPNSSGGFYSSISSLPCVFSLFHTSILLTCNKYNNK